VEEVLKEWLKKTKDRIEKDEKIREDLKEFDGIFQLAISDGESYHIALKKGEVGELIKGLVENPRLTVTSDTKTLKALMSGEMSAIKAFALRKIKVDGSLEDIIRLRNFMKTD
jgi:putative sterol carrier protein